LGNGLKMAALKRSMGFLSLLGWPGRRTRLGLHGIMAARTTQEYSSQLAPCVQP